MILARVRGCVRRDSLELVSVAQRNTNVWYACTFLSFLQFGLPIWVIFNREYLELSYTQAMVLGTTLAVAATVFEIPTGAWADRYGRLKLYRLGQLLLLLSIFSFVAFTNFWVLLGSQILGGLGWAMRSTVSRNSLSPASAWLDA